MRREQKRGVSSLRAKLILLTFSSLLCVAFAELWLRASAAASNAPGTETPEGRRFAPYTSDGLLGYRLQDNWRGVHEHYDFRVPVHTNALGMRGGPAEATQSGDVERILFLGDSYTFGFGVEAEDAYPSLVAEGLRSRGRRVEVLNAAVPGYSADHYLLYLTQRGFALEPDLVVVALSDNDAEDLGWSALSLDKDGLPTRTASRLRMIDRHGRMQYLGDAGVALPEVLVRPPGRLQDHSYLFNWLRYRLARLWVGLAKRRVAERYEGEEPLSSESMASLSEAQLTRALASEARFREHYHDHLMRELERRAAERAVPLRTLYLGPSPGPLQEQCAALRTHCLDLASLLSRAQQPEAFFPNDGHWNAEGHRRVADRLVEWLSSDAGAWRFENGSEP